MTKSKSTSRKRTTAKAGLKKKSKSTPSKENTPDFKGYESFSNTHGPLVIHQMADVYHKDLMSKSIDWIVFGDVAVSRKEPIDCEFAFMELNNSPSGWEHSPYTRAYSRKMKAVRYEKY